MPQSFGDQTKSLSQTRKKILIAVLILISIGIVVFLIISPRINPPTVKEKPSGEKSMEEQLRELDALRKDTSPLTEEEKKEQLKELELLNDKSEPLTKEQTTEQLEELNKLRKQ